MPPVRAWFPAFLMTVGLALIAVSICLLGLELGMRYILGPRILGGISSLIMDAQAYAIIGAAAVFAADKIALSRRHDAKRNPIGFHSQDS